MAGTSALQTFLLGVISAVPISQFQIMAELKSIKDAFKCDHCDKTFQIVSNRNRHMRRMHESQEPVTKAVPCSLCEYRCRDNYQLKVHMRSHTKDRPFPCVKCPYSSSRWGR